MTRITHPSYATASHFESSLFSKAICRLSKLVENLLARLGLAKEKVDLKKKSIHVAKPSIPEPIETVAFYRSEKEELPPQSEEIRATIKPRGLFYERAHQKAEKPQTLFLNNFINRLEKELQSSSSLKEDVIKSDLNMIEALQKTSHASHAAERLANLADQLKKLQ